MQLSHHRRLASAAAAAASDDLDQQHGVGAGGGGVEPRVGRAPLRLGPLVEGGELVVRLFRRGLVAVEWIWLDAVLCTPRYTTTTANTTRTATSTSFKPGTTMLPLASSRIGKSRLSRAPIPPLGGANDARGPHPLLPPNKKLLRPLPPPPLVLLLPKLLRFFAGSTADEDGVRRSLSFSW